MDILEVSNLTQMAQNKISVYLSSVEQLKNALHHNANQPNKQPLEDKLRAAQRCSKVIALGNLTYSQRNWLSELKIVNLIGELGSDRLEEIVQKSGYDPATALQEISDTQSKLSSAVSKLAKLHESLIDFPWIVDYGNKYSDCFEIRISFSKSAEIKDTHSLKKWSADWYEISRGIAGWVDEKPEDIEIVGVSNGSIILWLSATALVTTLLAKITKNICSMTLDGLQVASTIEDLRRKKYLNEGIRNSLEEDRKERLEKQKEELIQEIKQTSVHEISPEKESNLNRAIEKLLNFFEKGGDIDFLEPPEAEDENETDMSEAIDLINEIRQTKNEMLLIENRPDDDND